MKLDVVFRWIEKQPRKVKIPVAVLCLIVALIAVTLLVENVLFMLFLGEAIEGFGIVILIYKLLRSKTFPGISLRAQVLTALYLFMKLPGYYAMVQFELTFLDLCALMLSTLVIIIIWRKHNSTTVKELDNFPIIYLVVGAAVLAFLIHPEFEDFGIIAYLWAFSVYLKVVSVLPQLHLMRNEKMVQPITAHYVFAVGVGRFFCFAYWVAMVYELRGRFLFLVGYGSLWLSVAFISEIIHTFILADFCYYYVKAAMYEKLLGGLTATR